MKTIRAENRDHNNNPGFYCVFILFFSPSPLYFFVSVFIALFLFEFLLPFPFLPFFLSSFICFSVFWLLHVTGTLLWRGCLLLTNGGMWLNSWTKVARRFRTEMAGAQLIQAKPKQNTMI
jgi:hypothetical protein